MKKIILLALFLPLSAIAQAPAGNMPDMGDAFLQKFDANKDGVVNLTEFLQPTDQQFAMIDTNKDGVVNADEARAFSSMMLQRMQQMQQTMRQTQQPNLPR